MNFSKLRFALLSSVLLLTSQSAFSLPSTLPTKETRGELCLNGTWDATNKTGSHKVRVPGSWGYPDNFNTIFDQNDYDNIGISPLTYKRSVSVPSSFEGRLVKLYIGAVLWSAEVSLNGKKVGESHDATMPFEYTLNDALKSGTQELSILVNPRDKNTPKTQPHASQYFCHGRIGIWQDVILKSYPMLHVDNSFYVKTSLRENWIGCDIPVKNNDTKSRTFHIRNFVTDATGAIVKVLDVEGAKTLGAGDSALYTCKTTWSNPRIWWPHDPYRYTIHTVIYDGDESSVIDWKKTMFGFKEFWREGKYLYLNGKMARLRGDSHHYFNARQQTRVFAEKTFEFLMSIGVNYWRPHTMPYDPVMLDVADSMGMMIEDESGMHTSRDPNICYPDHLRRFIERDRNHPSVMFWSLSNERTNKSTKFAELDAMNDTTMKLDPMRIAYSNHWGRCFQEICSKHYTRSIANPDKNKPIIEGEYGYWWKNADVKSWGGTPGDIGYEAACQDITTGYYNFGKHYRDWTLQLQADDQFSGYTSWSIHNSWIHYQPEFNNTHRYEIPYADLTTPGAKPQYNVASGFGINSIDPALPTASPMYVFWCYANDLYRAVRCTDAYVDITGTKVEDFNYFAGETMSRKFSLAYEDFRDGTKMTCVIVDDSTKATLFSADHTEAPFNNLEPGKRYAGPHTVTWKVPTTVARVTPVHFNRVFYSGSSPVCTVSVTGKIFPRFTTAQVPLAQGKKIGLFDPAGGTKTILDGMGVSYTSVAALSSVTSANYDLVIIGANNTVSGLSADFVKNGGRVLCLEQTTKPNLPVAVELASSSKKDAQFLLNGRKHAVFTGLDQNDLSHWRGGAATMKNPFKRPSSGTFRVLIVDDGDGTNAPMLEAPLGKGTILLSQMNIVAMHSKEPVAGQMLCNMIDYLCGYTPAAKAKTGLIATGGAYKTWLDNMDLRYTALKADALPDLSGYTLLIVDGSSSSILSGLAGAKSKLDAFVSDGGKIMLCQLSRGTASAANTLLPKSVTLSVLSAINDPTGRTRMYPITAQKKRAIKCAKSWELRSTTRDPVRYAHINIPPSFEPNQDPLLMGIVNKDLDWSVNQIDLAAKTDGPFPDGNELIALREPLPWSFIAKETIDGKSHSEAATNSLRGRYRGDWFVNREPVLLKEPHGKGFWLVNQMLSQNGGDQAKRVNVQLLTSLGASLGDDDTYYNLDYAVQSPSPNRTPIMPAVPALRSAERRSAATVRTAGSFLAIPRDFVDAHSRVRLFNALGRCVGSIEIEPGSGNRLSLTKLGLATGLYIAEIRRMPLRRN